MEPLIGIILIAFVVWRYGAKSSKPDFQDIATRPKALIPENNDYEDDKAGKEKNDREKFNLNLE